MNILLIILSCSFFNNDILVKSIINIRSCSNQYFVCDVVTMKEYHNNSLSEAKESYKIILDNGGKPLIGLMGIPYEISFKYGYEPFDLFDPCVNIQIGSDILLDIYEHMPKSKNKNNFIIQKYLEILGYHNEYIHQQTRSVLANIELLKNSKAFNEEPNLSSIAQENTDKYDDQVWSNNSIYLKDKLYSGKY